MFNRELIYEYENMLIGKRTFISPYLFNKSPYENERKALYIIDYAIKTYLGWTPWQTRDNMSMEVLRKLKLDKILHYINFPCVIQIDDPSDIFYLAVKLYPTIINYNERELILRVYKKVLNSKLKRFPKEYLAGAEGLHRAKLCFCYMLSQYFNFQSIEQMYYFFSGKEGNKAMRNYRLAPVSKDLFETNIDFLHESLPEAQQDVLLYAYYKFEILYTA